MQAGGGGFDAVVVSAKIYFRWSRGKKVWINCHGMMHRVQVMWWKEMMEL